jgi:hypothetical protein
MVDEIIDEFEQEQATKAPLSNQTLHEAC